MKKHISYTNIEQLRHLVATINRESAFVRVDENKNPIYDYNKPKPKVLFKGTVKVHGTNASVAFNDVSGIWAQSKENILTIEADNFSFAFFVESKKEMFTKLFNSVKEKYNIDTTKNTITIYGEWAGGAIQKGVAISGMEKAFFIFGCKVSPFDGVATWVDYSFLRSDEDRIFNIDDFGTYNIEIDFNFPEHSQNKLIEMTMGVENECPVAKKLLGITGIGEGIVFACEYNGSIRRFKSKGPKHSVSKVKVLNPVDTEKIDSIREFVEYAVTEARFDQSIEKVFGEEKPSITKMVDVLRWMMGDIVKEEMDVMIENKLDPKDVAKYVSHKTRLMFMDLIKEKV